MMGFSYLRTSWRRLLVVSFLLASTAVLSAVVVRSHYKRKMLRGHRAERQALQAKNDIKTVSLNPINQGVKKSVPTTVGDLSYDKVLDELIATHRTDLDRGPKEWQPTDVQFKEPKEKGRTFTLDDLPAPTEEQWALWKKPRLVRPMPYPYFSSLAIPSDCCGSLPADMLYMHQLVSRTYGLDLPGSFWMYSASNNAGYFGNVPAIFHGVPGDDPLEFPIRLETEAIDQFPLLLTYYYRGWIDHLHDWNHGAAANHSMIEPATSTVASGGQGETKLKPKATYGNSWFGFELKVEMDDKVEAFEIEMRDQNEVPHYLVYGKPLGDRQGWDLSGLAREKLRRVYLPLAEEKNRRLLTTLGLGQVESSSEKTLLHSATLKAWGKQGAEVKLESLRCYDLTREAVQRQIEAARRFNILPIASTWHGGYSSWTACLDPGPKDVLGREPLGATPGSPGYCADLLADFGLVHHNYHEDTQAEKSLDLPLLGVKKLPNGQPYYHSLRLSNFAKNQERFPTLTANLAWMENLGVQGAKYLSSWNRFGQQRMLFTHFNCYGPEAFEPKAQRIMQLSLIKRLDERAQEWFAALANAKYNLDGQRPDHQRLWVAPVSVLLRHAQVVQALEKNAQRKGNDVHITPWKDEVTGKPVPDAAFATQDLHGQTLYVPDARLARVFLGEREITCLTRNAKDFTGQESVTIVDEHTPTLVFDELDLYEHSGRVAQQGASCFFRSGHAHRGRYSLEVRTEEAGAGHIVWKPLQLDNHETEFLRFAFKKSNPGSKVWIGWSFEGEMPQFVASEGHLPAQQGWLIPSGRGEDYQEVVLNLAAMQAPAEGKKIVPRGRIVNFFFGLTEAKAGDSVHFDAVEFLAARGLRPSAHGGLVLGGRLKPHRDGEIIKARWDNKTVTTETARGGWFWFTGVPKNALVEVTWEREGITYFPLRGRLHQAVRNDLELHIFAVDPRCPSTPRPSFAGRKVPEGYQRFTGPKTFPGPNGNHFLPHTMRSYAGQAGNPLDFIVEENVNNFGFLDRDRDVAAQPGTLRLFLHGTCMEEGAQTPTHQHVNMLLESMLRRETGVPVEVAVASHSNSSASANAYLFEKYGKRFQPHFVVLMNDAVNLWHLEPKLLEKAIGWPKGHTPYQGADFDKDGKLVLVPPDPNFPAYAVAPDNQSLQGDLSLNNTYFSLSNYAPLVVRSFQLFQAVARDVYLKELDKHGGKLVVAAGYIRHYYPDDSVQAAPPFQVHPDRYLRSLRRATEEVGAHFADLSGPLRRVDFKNTAIWATDGHLTPAGHYLLARALADYFLTLPEFQQQVEKLRTPKSKT